MKTILLLLLASQAHAVLINGNQINSATQITISSITTMGNGFKGNGSAITALTPANISAGAIPATVYVSSIQTGSYENVRVGTSTLSTKATALAATPSSCSAGNFPLGVDAQGNAQSCTSPSNAITAATNTWTATQKYLAQVEISTGGALSIDGGAGLYVATPSTMVAVNFTGGRSTSTFAGWVDIGLTNVNNTCTSAEFCSALCASGYREVGGGCGSNTPTAALNVSAPLDSPVVGGSVPGWYCEYTVGSISVSVSAICARIK